MDFDECELLCPWVFPSGDAAHHPAARNKGTQGPPKLGGESKGSRPQAAVEDDGAICLPSKAAFHPIALHRCEKKTTESCQSGWEGMEPHARQ